MAEPFLRALDPETAHRLTLRALALGLGPHTKEPDPPALAQTRLGITLPNPIGLAAGFDKDAEAVDALFGLGFGFVEAGTVTPRPQSGNPRPRLFRLRQDGAVINRMGFNNRGYAAARRRLIERQGRPGVVGINIGANKDSADPIEDYRSGLEQLGPHAAYVTVNVSSPNTPGLRSLQAREPLERLLSALAETRARVHLQKPVFLKIAPDLEEEVLGDIVALAVRYGLDGLIVSNTTLARPASLKGAHAREAGGLSGAPLMAPATALLAKAARLAQGRLMLIGVGGIGSGADAYAKIKAGASLVQLYTALAYQGPSLITRIKRELATLLAADGFASIGEAVGKGLP